MNKIEEILQSKHKPKEKVILLAEEIKRDKSFVHEIVGYFSSASTGDRGHLIESLEYISHDHPEYIEPHFDFILGHLEDKAPRVKWESARIIANLSGQFSGWTQRAIFVLLKNSQDKGVVVRWSVAFALGEVAKNNQQAAKILFPEIKKLAEKETNNGVKNVYLKVLKVIGKGK